MIQSHTGWNLEHSIYTYGKRNPEKALPVLSSKIIRVSLRPREHCKAIDLGFLRRIFARYHQKIVAKSFHVLVGDISDSLICVVIENNTIKNHTSAFEGD
jgi:hypothetical protein